MLIRAGSDVESRDAKGKTLLGYAIRNPKIVRPLIAAKANVHAADDEGNTVLLLAARSNSSDAVIDVVKQLLKKKADISVRNKDGSTVLHLVVDVWGDDATLCEFLITSGADVNSRNAKGETPLMLCRDSEFTKCLIKHSAQPDLQDGEGQAVIVRLVSGYKSDNSQLRVLIRAGANINVKDKNGRTALMHGVRFNTRAAKILIDAGADLNLVDNEGRTALSYASPDAARLLIEAGAVAHASESTPLLSALAAEDIPLTIMLLERGARATMASAGFLRDRKCLEKIARSNAQLLKDGLLFNEPPTTEEFDRLIARYAKVQDFASDADLPPDLRQGAWPVKHLKRKPLVIAAAVFKDVDFVSHPTGTLMWQQDRKESLLRKFERHGTVNAKRKAQEALESQDADAIDAKFEEDFLLQISKSKRVAFSNLIAGSDRVVTSIWNKNAEKLVKRLVVGRYGDMKADHFEFLLARLDMAVLPGVLTAAGKSLKFTSAIKMVNSPACAPLMSKWMSGGNESRVARQWALNYPDSCARGLMAIATGKLGKDREMAEAAVRYLAFKGHRAIVESVAAEFGAEVSASISEVLSMDPRADFMPKKTPNFPKFWSADVYPSPRLLSNGKDLPAHAVDALAGMMAVSSLDVQTLALDDVIAACDPKSLANFAWSAFEEWALKGDKSSDWIFDSLSYLGDDECARKLTPRIR
ncbi:MAG: ankyrin repeat domain-containing protein, partial [Sideroxyarcus sp.]|nr:ankyrin repeat domain-containing protein [Sideroxyarcus sp.]